MDVRVFPHQYYDAEARWYKRKSVHARPGCKTRAVQSAFGFRKGF